MQTETNQKLRSEILNLFQYVQRLREEIGRIAQQPEGQTRFEKMSDQLDAILTSTGEATNTVLEDFEAITSAAKEKPSSDAGVTEIQTTENHTGSNDTDDRMDDLKKAFEGLNSSDEATTESDSDEIEEWDRNKSATDDTENKKE